MISETQDHILDDWNPDITKKDSILNKFQVNFTNKEIKKLAKIEAEENENIQKDYMNDEGFGEETESDPNLMFDFGKKDTEFQKKMKSEHFYDPLSDEKNEIWLNKTLKKDKKSQTVLSCPYCFTALCYDCQRHDIYENQYRAVYVHNCRIDCSKSIKPKEEKEKKLDQQDEENKLEELKEKFRFYFSVECSICHTEVGVYETDEKIYHFFHVIAGLG